MKVALKDGRRAAEKDISALEAIAGGPLDGQLRRFIEIHDGAEPEENSFPVDGVAHMGGVEAFISIKDIIEERKSIDDIAPRAFPVAISAGGNYVILDQDQGGAVFFWDHEVEGGVSRLADSFDAFLEMLEPFDASSIELAPGQVESVWIDPDFLEELKRSSQA